MKLNFTHHRQLLEYGWNESYPDMYCFSTTRHGGCSEGEYASFNCNGYCGDAPANVERNLAQLEALLPGEVSGVILPHQTHGTEVRVVDEALMAAADDEREKALYGVDAVVTSLQGVCIGVSTADCIPVFLYDTRLRVIAAVHAGWRGTCERITECTLQQMQRTYGTRPADVAACIGPGISLKAFEVGDEVYARFQKAGFCMEQVAVRYDKWHIDLWKANQIILQEAGVPENKILVSGICTWGNNADFFSARRQGISSGRIYNGIMMIHRV